MRNDLEAVPCLPCSVCSWCSSGPKKPAKRIIYICDWHLVSSSDYHIDQEHARGAPVSKAEIGESYRAFVHEVAAVQVEQLALLRMFPCHGVKEVFSEGYAVGHEAN